MWSARWAVGLVAVLMCRAAENYRWELPHGFPAPKVPADNPMSEAKVRLGRYLFYDTRLSVNGKSSCATCHRQELAFSDGRAIAVGATGQDHPRSAPSLVNVAYSGTLTWSDPGLHALEAQALVPMFGDHPVELGLRRREAAVLRELRSDTVYRALFPAAFPEMRDGFTMPNVAKALASFERTIVSARSPYDRYHYGGDRNAISESAQRGEALFFGDPAAGCFRCHSGFNFSDGKYHNTALYNLRGTFSYPWPNLGIYVHTRKLEDVGKFRTPTLRNVALTAPYMHDGSVATLEDAIEHYAAGGRNIASGPYAGCGHDNQHKDARMTGFVMTKQNRADLLEFLRSLTDRELISDPRFSNPW
jgi:cytochrome c peroxidase